MLYVNASISKTKTRKETLFGNDYLVAPVVALIEGVIHPSNAPSPELALAEEFGKFPGGWNGRPVTIGHPEINGMKVSANSPEVLEAEFVGMLFNTVLDGQKLKSEIWLDVGRITTMKGMAKQLMDLIEAGDTVEVSTGLFMALEEIEGQYGDKKFNGIWRDVVPDHLAILPVGTRGACSVEDGCGTPRVNKRGANMNPPNLISVQNGNVTTCTAASGEGTCKCSDCQKKNKIFIPTFQTLIDKFKGVLRIHSSVIPTEAVDVIASKDGLVTSSEGISDSDKRIALKAALQAEGRDGCYIVAVFVKTFVYEDYDFDSGRSGFYERGYSIKSEGKVVLKEGAVQVRPETVFVPVTNQSDNQEEPKMADKAKVDALIANSATKFTENDRTWLIALTDVQVDQMIPEAPAPVNAVVTPSNTILAVAAPANPVAPAVNTQIAPTAAAVQTVAAAMAPAMLTAEQYTAAAPPEIREILENGIRMSKAHRDQMIATIKANKANPFTDAELNVKSAAELDKLVKISQTTVVTNYDARPAPNGVAPSTQERYAAPMPSLVVKKPAPQSNAA